MLYMCLFYVFEENNILWNLDLLSIGLYPRNVIVMDFGFVRVPRISLVAILSLIGIKWSAIKKGEYTLSLLTAGPRATYRCKAAKRTRGSYLFFPPTFRFPIIHNGTQHFWTSQKLKKLCFLQVSSFHFWIQLTKLNEMRVCTFVNKIFDRKLLFFPFWEKFTLFSLKFV